jgi:hypothetical protein
LPQKLVKPLKNWPNCYKIGQNGRKIGKIATKIGQTAENFL